MALLAVLALAFLAFGPAISGPFDFDDGLAIEENPTIRNAWPPSALWERPQIGSATAGRPVVNYSFALNVAFNRLLGIGDGLSPAGAAARSFHVVNILLHVAVALLLFATIRRAMASESIEETWRRSADKVAAVACVLWLVHPIHTEPVDYISQRTELLCALFIMITLYASIRALPESSGSTEQAALERRRQLRWSVVAVIALALGMASKEVMVVAPVLVFLYDQAFASRSRTRSDVRARRGLYVALIATTLICLVFVAAGERGHSAGFSGPISAWQYLASQGWAITHYVKLLLWPDDLSFDYGRRPIPLGIAAPGVIMVALAGGATLWAWRKRERRWLGFLGAWFFLLLAPSSSIVPIHTEIAAERRVYLASIAVILLIVIGAERLRRELTAGRTKLGSRAAVRIRTSVLALVFVGIVAVLVATSAMRSRLYADPIGRWEKAVAQTPTNGRAYDNLASAMLRSPSPDLKAVDSVLNVARRVDPEFLPAWYRAATIAMAEGRLAQAESLLVQSLRLQPGYVPSLQRLAEVHLMQREPTRALPYLRVLADNSPSGESLTNLGVAYLMARQLDSGIAVLTRAARRDSTRGDTQRSLAAALIERDQGAEAYPYAVRAVKLEPQSGVALGLLSLAAAQSGRVDIARQAAAAAAENARDNPTVFLFAGRASHLIGLPDDAVDYYNKGLRLQPADPQLLTRLGISELALGDTSGATRHLERALQIAPGFSLAQEALTSIRRDSRRR
ncbi:MAG TPA: tetratricopeptide repeat protein [Gemmatimonadaceae bacterium]